MSRIYLQMYAPFSVSGKDFLKVDSASNLQRRILFSSDNKHLVYLNFLRDGLLLFTNETKVEFQFTVGRNARSMALVKFEHNDVGKIYVNNNFKISKAGVMNREIYENPNTMISSILHGNVNGDGVGRIDLKVDDSLKVDLLLASSATCN